MDAGVAYTGGGGGEVVWFDDTFARVDSAMSESSEDVLSEHLALCRLL